MAQGAAVLEDVHEVQRDCQGGQGGPILGRLHAAEHCQLLRSFEVCTAAFSRHDDCRVVHSTLWPLRRNQSRHRVACLTSCSAR